MKKVFKTEEISHLWANQTQEEARNSQGNLFFDKDKIYSYSRHFCIAKILPNGIVLFTTQKYSNTTAKRYTTNKEVSNEAGLMEVRVINDLGEPHIIGDFWRHFKIVS